MTQRAAQPDQDRVAQPDQDRVAQPDQHGAAQPQPGPVYEVRVRGVLEERWSSWFDGLDIVAEPPENSLIVGAVADQCALHGLLAKVRDLGLPLISVQLIEE
jgi:hypothetical protein